eukprot:scaffold1981_cov345-Pinguiococcus_pyrenoidosus.AAC.9
MEALRHNPGLSPAAVLLAKIELLRGRLADPGRHLLVERSPKKPFRGESSMHGNRSDGGGVRSAFFHGLDNTLPQSFTDGHRILNNGGVALVHPIFYNEGKPSSNYTYIAHDGSLVDRIDPYPDGALKALREAVLRYREYRDPGEDGVFENMDYAINYARVAGHFERYHVYRDAMRLLDSFFGEGGALLSPKNRDKRLLYERRVREVREEVASGNVSLAKLVMFTPS